MIPFLLAAAGGYLIASSLKSKQYADGGKVKTYTDAELLEKFKRHKTSKKLVIK